MVLYDKTSDEIIDILDVHFNSWMVQNGLPRNQYQGPFESNITIKLDISYLLWVKDWLGEIWLGNGKFNYSNNYKREIFITNKGDMKFVGAYPKSYQYDDRTIELEFTCDYHDINGSYPELKQIYRDRKINQILG